MLGIVLSILLICWTKLASVALAVSAPSTSPTRSPTFRRFPTANPTRSPTVEDPRVQPMTTAIVFLALFMFVGAMTCMICCFRHCTRDGARMRLSTLEKRERTLNAKMHRIEEQRRLENQIISGWSSYFSSAQRRQLRYDGYVKEQKRVRRDIRYITESFFPEEETRAAGNPYDRMPPSFAGIPDARASVSFAPTSAVEVRESVQYAHAVTTGDLDPPTATVTYPRI